jgi:HK97 family phage portal protein
MGLLDLISFRRAAPKPKPPAVELRGLSDGTGPWSAFINPEAVTPEVAIRTTAILANVRFLSQSVASMPLRVIRTSADGRKSAATDLPCYGVLTDTPNATQSLYEWVESTIYHTALWGNAYSRIVPSVTGGFCSALELMHPSRMKPGRMSDGSVGYRYYYPQGAGPQGQTGWVPFSQDEILHVRWLSDNGIVGLVPSTLCNTSVALARELDISARAFWANGARPDLVIETEETLNQEAVDKFRAQWREIYGGSSKRGGAAILPRKATLKTIDSNSNEASEFSQLRRDVTAEVATIYGVPGSLVGVRDAMKYATTEQEHLSAQVWCLLPWEKRLEGAINRTILTPLRSGPLYVGCKAKVDNRGLLRGDSAARGALYDVMAKWGGMQPAEMRDLEDLPELDEPAQKETYIQSGFVPLRKAADQSLSEAQVSSLLAVLAAVSAGTLAAPAAEAVIAAAYPTLADSASTIVAGAKGVAA